MKRTFGSAVALFVALFALSASAQEQSVLAIELRVAPTTVELGEPVILSLWFGNTGAAAFYLERSYDITFRTINVVARRGQCLYRIEPSIATTSSEPGFTRLLPGDRLIQSMTLNGAGTELFVPGPGTYHIEATFRSEGPEAASGQAPVWRGFVRSSEVELQIIPPNPAKLETKRRALQNSLETGEKDFDAIAYFRLVRDPEVANLLVRLLERSVIDPLLLEAIAHQNRPSDAPALERAAASASLPQYAMVADYARELAKRLRKPDTCG